MIAALLAVLLLPAGLHAEYNPLPASTPEATDKNFKDVDEEIRRLDASISSVTLNASVWNSTQTFNYPATFFSSVTFSSNVVVHTVGSTVTVSGVANWEWLVMSTRVSTNIGNQSFGSNVATFTLTNLLQPYETDASSIPWHLKYNCYLSSSVGASYALDFNDDTGANYAYTHSRVTNAGVGGAAPTAGRWIALQDYTTTLGVGPSHGDFYFMTQANASNSVSFWGNGNEPNQNNSLLGGTYTGSAVVSKFSIATSVVNIATSQPDRKMSMICLLELLRGIGPAQIGNP